MALHALVIAAEKYNDPKIKPVLFAEQDAAAFAEAVEALGAVPANVTVLTNSMATKTTIESKLRTITRYLEEADEFFLYYAGHGVSVAGKNYLVCNDSVPIAGEIPYTCVELSGVLSQIRASKCKQVSLFLDACHSGVEIDEEMRSLVSVMTDEEFKDFCGESEHYVAFSACSTNERSYSSRVLKHGIWTHHLVQALTGVAPSALNRERFVTASSLQNYLSAEVPRTVRETRTDKSVQTPTCWGNLSREFIVADLRDLLSAKSAARKSVAQITDTIMQHTSIGAVRSLSGFQRRHTVPDSVNHVTRAFVQGIGTEEADGFIDEIHSKLKSKIRYKRRDLKIENDEGFTAIVTPDFTYSVYLDIDPDDPSQYILEKSISQIHNPDIIADERFFNIFDGCFDTVEISLKQTIDVEDVIDAIEEQDSIPVDYPADASSCSISPKGTGLTIRFEPNKIVLAYASKYMIETMLSDCQSLPVHLHDAGGAGVAKALLP